MAGRPITTQACWHRLAGVGEDTDSDRYTADERLIAEYSLIVTAFEIGSERLLWHGGGGFLHHRPGQLCLSQQRQ